MRQDERIFVKAIRRYCERHDIAVEPRAEGWLIVMRRGQQRRFAFGYDLGINSAIAHRIANDKAATAEVLALAAVPNIAHHLFLNPKMGRHLSGPAARDAMVRLLEDNPQGVVVKPNEGTAGRSVFRVATRAQLEAAAAEISSANLALAIAPYVEIEEEVRVVLLDEMPMVVYAKRRPLIVGDGRHSLRELAAAAAPPAEGWPTNMLDSLEPGELDGIVPVGERRLLNWRHNLDAGARPVVLDHGEMRTQCVRLAVDAARAIGIDFASIDLVRCEGAWNVLEVNSGVMMEQLGKSHPGLVYATYEAALDRIFKT